MNKILRCSDTKQSHNVNRPIQTEKAMLPTNILLQRLEMITGCHEKSYVTLHPETFERKFKLL